MTTYAAVLDAQEIEALTCAAWTTYSEELHQLSGQAYVDAERAAWDRLQASLRELAARRPALPAPR
jgi:uncharacterized protein with beta-barrel porin domain